MNERRLAAIMFTDIVGYSALTQQDETLTLELLEEHRKLLRPLFSRYGGHEIKTMADGFLVEFASALHAVSCAIEIQKVMRARNLASPAERRLEIRIGIHIGDIVHRENDVLGDGVNIAARLQPLADPGGICISEDVARLIRNKIDEPLIELGKRELKNIEEPIGIYKIALSQAVPNPSLQEKRSIAVLPFANLSPDPENEYFSDGLTEELINSLTKIEGLRVASRTSAFAWKGKQENIRKIGEQLNVETVLEGSVRKAGNRLRITAQLVNITDDSHLWSERYDREMEDVFVVQDEIARAIVEALKIKLAQQRPLITPPTEHIEAYTLYLQGRFHWNKRSKEGFERAIQYFEQALQIDPTYARAYAGLADCYTLLASYGHLDPQEGFPKAREAARKALDLDEMLAEAHASLAAIKLNHEQDIQGAQEEIERAIELNPNYATAHHWHAATLVGLGRVDEALAAIQRALELDPLSAIMRVTAGEIFQLTGRWQEAEGHLHKALELNPHLTGAQIALATMLQLSGNWQRAEQELQRVIALAPKDSKPRRTYAFHLASLGRLPESLIEIDRTLELSPGSLEIRGEKGVLLYCARQYDQAIEQLQKTLEMNPHLSMADLFIGLAYIEKTMYAEALAALQRAIDLSKSPNPKLTMWVEAGRAIAYARMGQREIAQKVLERLMALPKQNDHSLTIALGYAALGEKEQAWEWLERAYQEKNSGLLFIKVWPTLDNLRSDSQYAELLKKMGLAP
jgi:TolB-like protein/class 3 adenylate cyclase/Tfp pilus assembly protein PilF